MKKLLCLLLSLLLALSLCACGKTQPPADDGGEAVIVRLGALKGPTAMGMVSLFDAADKGSARQNYTYQLAGAADELTPLLLKGELDILAVPANLAAVLYNNSQGAVEMLAVNTLGVLYIVEKGEKTVTSWEDLRGQTILSSGKGASPEYVLNYLLAENGLTPGTDVTVEWKNEHAEVVAAMAQSDHAVAMLPQPFVTVAQGKLEGLSVALDLTAAWDSLQNGSHCITGCLVVRREFAESHPEAVETFLEEYAASTAFAAEEPAACAQLIEHYGILEKAAIAERALPYCNIVCITGADMVKAASGYLQVLFDQNPKAVGGAMPGDDFFFLPGAGADA